MTKPIKTKYFWNIDHKKYFTWQFVPWYDLKKHLVNGLWWDRRSCISVNTLRPKEFCRHFADDTLKCIFFNENIWNAPNIPLKFVPMVQINNIPALYQLMALRRPGDKPSSEWKMESSLTHICVTRPQCVTLINLIMKIYEFRLICHWSLFLRSKLTILKHWFRSWLDADQATSHYLNQGWIVHWHINALNKSIR